MPPFFQLQLQNFKTSKLQNFKTSKLQIFKISILPPRNTKTIETTYIIIIKPEKQSPKRQNSPDSLERAGRGCLVTNLI
jgi:hypothetical protein